MSQRKPALRMRVQQFLYKATHQMHMIGAVWSHIPGFSHRQLCMRCYVIESMEHILTQCPINVNRSIWSLVKLTWPHSQELWPEISLGLIIEIGCANVPWNRVHPLHLQHHPRAPSIQQRGATRLLHIIILEAAHLIWVMRCKRVIQNRQHTDDETRAKWLRTINERLTRDRIIATKIKQNTKHTKLIKHTWGPILQNHCASPDDWLCHQRSDTDS